MEINKQSVFKLSFTVPLMALDGGMRIEEAKFDFNVQAENEEEALQKLHSYLGNVLVQINEELSSIIKRRFQ